MSKPHRYRRHVKYATHDQLSPRQSRQMRVLLLALGPSETTQKCNDIESFSAIIPYSQEGFVCSTDLDFDGRVSFRLLLQQNQNHVPSQVPAPLLRGSRPKVGGTRAKNPPLMGVQECLRVAEGLLSIVLPPTPSELKASHSFAINLHSVCASCSRLLLHVTPISGTFFHILPPLDEPPFVNLVVLGSPSPGHSKSACASIFSGR
ncbi:hypothetical protein EDD37DRAFT_46819 [Exophiala viscosa]|uniref:Uncharacterized protein n=1 Tax=Exophiala viscosa TaxID=2486360 RepID=A0AAN6E2V3_9EURO|nr:hypothetical protein EDD36DRAFT_154645 [Exophiala viscosa]KAI1629313.1 hypothetical protein EDD37DRAFT_46819 [Exophiala viscosa]